MLVPPDNFAFVEDGLYRCSALDAINAPFLETLGLSTIVWLDEEKPPRAINQYIEDNRVRLCHLKESSVIPEDTDSMRFQDWMVLRPTLVAETFQILLDYQTYHDCLLVDRSEVVIGLLRRIQRWSYSSISNEYRLFANNKANYAVENYLELVNIELVPYERMADQDDEDEETVVVEEPKSLEKDLSISPHLSVSTSPQIPKTLLKMVEMRRQKRKHRQERQQSISYSGVSFFKPAGTASVRVRLPREENLPAWFIELRTRWEQEA
ncbi:hypothetical protein KL937_004720 [Ogataea polymorpha]|uniref:uncharacterized protein n=1 Tax=Ogataea polymorpha TaxID=460523 RepID=UPI0007F43BCD|nr:uncharacterized protein OGAPODRAFT_10025 [Ogataea polymorpha]KAG7877525.1 hypothetical protein KL937_004720 [Ogataea polymorpha]KAG7932009.1 hypothetical protein KL904_004756 [Ogataea polymorpha]OBA14511.1 hypothetical protein OGAPODRAFT_10025 [Ogataea polymorpha]